MRSIIDQDGNRWIVRDVIKSGFGVGQTRPEVTHRTIQFTSCDGEIQNRIIVGRSLDIMRDEKVLALLNEEKDNKK